MPETLTEMLKQTELKFEKTKEEWFEQDKETLKYLGSSTFNARDIGAQIQEFINLYEKLNPFWEDMETFLRANRIPFSEKDIYKPISQVAAFENINLEKSTNSQKVSLFAYEILKTFFETFMSEDSVSYPSNESGDFIVSFSSSKYKRASYLSKLYLNETWKQNYFKKEQKELDIVLNFLSSFLSGLNLDEFRLLRFSFSEETTEAERSSIPGVFHASISANSFEEKEYPLSLFLKSLSKLHTFVQCMELLSDAYPIVQKQVMDIYEKEQETYQEENEMAITSFESSLDSRVVDMDSINHKAAKHKAKMNNITKVFVPFSEKEQLLPIETLLSVYVTNSGEWVILPPTKEHSSSENLSYCGVFQYAGYSEEEKSHQVKEIDSSGEEGLLYSVSLNIELFNFTFLESYADWEGFQAVSDASTLLETNPQMFRKTSLLMGEVSTESVQHEPVKAENSIPESQTSESTPFTTSVVRSFESEAGTFSIGDIVGVSENDNVYEIKQILNVDGRSVKLYDFNDNAYFHKKESIIAPTKEDIERFLVKNQEYYPFERQQLLNESLFSKVLSKMCELNLLNGVSEEETKSCLLLDILTFRNREKINQTSVTPLYILDSASSSKVHLILDGSILFSIPVQNTGISIERSVERYLLNFKEEHGTLEELRISEGITALITIHDTNFNVHTALLFNNSNQ